MSRHIVLAAACLALGACTIPDKLCETSEKDNRCESNAECMIGYCAAQCDNCRHVYSERQMERAYCLVEPGGDIPDRCRDAYFDQGCDSEPPPVCPPVGEPRCEEGRCVMVMP